MGGLSSRDGFHAISRLIEVVLVLWSSLKRIATTNLDFRGVTLAEHLGRVNREVSRLGNLLDLVNAVVVVIRDYVCQLATAVFTRLLIVIGTLLLHNLEGTIRHPSVI